MKSFYFLFIFFYGFDFLFQILTSKVHMFSNTNALFVSALTFSGKCFIFQRVFSRKLSHYSVFGNNFENEIENVFWCLVCNFLKIFLV